jgi:signal transduction histidine kinase/ligand-binding sensor domain-containing protein/DNA-binding response OmpR family regulator
MGLISFLSVFPSSRVFAASVCCVAILFNGKSVAQSIPLEPNFDHITVNEGLSHSDAMEVIQDHEGFIWIGTNKGLDRYDGTKIKNYPFLVSSAYSLSDNRIRSLHVDGAGDLWVGTENGGLNYYDRIKDRFVRINSTLFGKEYHSVSTVLERAFVTSITACQDLLYVGTFSNGVFVIQRGELGNFISIRRAPLPFEKSYDYSVTDIKTTSEKEVLAGTASEGLFVVRNNDHPNLEKIQFPSDSIQALHVDQDNNLWIGASQKVYLLRHTTSIPGSYKIVATSKVTFPGLSSLHRDSFNRIWVGTAHGLFIIHAAGDLKEYDPGNSLRNGFVETILPQDGDPASLSSSRVHKIIEDKFQVLWIGTSAGGINKVNLLAKRFNLIRRQFGKGTTLPSNYINAIYKEEARNLLWIATRNGFSKYDLATKTYTNYLSNDFGGDATGIDVSSIFQDSNGNLWFGTWYDGLIYLRRKGGVESIQRRLAGTGDSELSDNNVIDFAEDTFGFVWATTMGGGLNKYTKDGEHVATCGVKNYGLPTNNYLSLYYESPGHVLWATSKDAGLLKFEVRRDTLIFLKQFKHDSTDNQSLAVNYTWPIMKDHHNNLWIGTLSGGLHQLVRDAAGHETIIRYGKWLPESDVESIEEDKHGNLWIGGAGLWQFNPETKHVLRLDVSDGLQSNSFKVGASWVAKDGTFYFGGIHGITAFKPDEIALNPYPPNVIITGLRIFNKPISIDEKINGRILLDKNLSYIQEITIKAGENDFSIDFVALHYSNPGKNSYAYKLEGYHKDWIYPPHGQLTANFTNLSSGDYTFRVKASNGDGIWSERSANLKIRVLPPWWQTWWANTLYVGISLCILAVYRRIRKAQGELRNKLMMEKIHHDKDQELNALKLKFFTNVSHELRTPLTLLLGPLEELIHAAARLNGMRDKVFLMYQQVRKLLDLVNQLMDFQKIESDRLTLRVVQGNVVKFLHEIFLIFKLKSEESNLNYSFVSSLEKLPLCFDAHKLEIVVVNLLSNAFKYTVSQGSIQVSISVVGEIQGEAVYDEGRLLQNYCCIKIKDSGVGIDPKELDKIFDPYYQATHTDTLQIMGTGIGLSVVKAIIDRHRGEIIVRSEKGEGTEFSIHIPLGKSHVSQEEWQQGNGGDDVMFSFAQAHELHPTANLLQGEDMQLIQDARLLIVEDNPDIAYYLEKMFKEVMNVDVAFNGRTAYEKALDLMPDIILSDIMMPDGNGLELCKKIKENPKTMHITVLLLTARIASVHELEGLESGADDYITKPFIPSLLKAKLVGIILNRRRLQEFYNNQILLEPAEISIPDKDRQFLEMSMRIVENNIENPEFNVQTLIREAGMSQSVFYRRIKNTTGLSAIEFIRDIRLKLAAQLLAKGSLRVSEVSIRVGIDDIKYFRKVFHQRYHMSPAEFAKKYHTEVHDFDPQILS